MKTKFYELSQNNSGGSFIVNDKLCHRLFIEAESITEAINKAEDFGCYWDGVNKGLDCSCCGDRWYEPNNSVDLEYINSKIVGKIQLDSIEQHAQLMANLYGWTKPDCRIFYKDGRIKDVYSKKIK